MCPWCHGVAIAICVPGLTRFGTRFRREMRQPAMRLGWLSGCGTKASESGVRSAVDISKAGPDLDIRRGGDERLVAALQTKLDAHRNGTPVRVGVVHREAALDL